MDSLIKKKKIKHVITTTKNTKKQDQNFIDSCCFFCTMKEQDPILRKAGIAKWFKEMPLRDDQELVLVLSGLWHIAMNHPDDSEFPSLGIFECMASLIYKGINDIDWLLRDQNIYIPYYAAHIIGSYTMNKVEFAETAVREGVIPPLMELLRGKITWVEQRVAVRALGHLASYDNTYDNVAEYEEELVMQAMQLASTCFEVMYADFVAVDDKQERLKYHCDLLTRGAGELDMENRKAEEWASQLQCWSIYLLNCFACKERSLSLICQKQFLNGLCGMWGGLVNHSSPAGVGLIRILCYSKYGRKNVAESREVLLSLCNLSRSSDDWQYMGIDCLLFLLNDSETRYIVIEHVFSYLLDLVELKSLGDRSNLGETISKSLLLDYKHIKTKFKDTKFNKSLQDIWELKVGRRKREEMMSQEKLEERRILAILIKQEGNYNLSLGEIESAIVKYTEALELCPLRFRKERMTLYSNRAQCHLLLKDSDGAIRDSTRALCLSNPANSHRRSLWRRSQAYDMKGLAKESLMDCIMFVNCYAKSESRTNSRIKIPYYAARMISKQMEATWIFAHAQSLTSSSKFSNLKEPHDANGNKNVEKQQNDEMMMENKDILSVFSGMTINKEELFMMNGKCRRICKKMA